MRSRLAFHENGRSLTSGWVGESYAPQNGSGLGKVFLFVAVRRGVAPPGSAHPLYAPTARLVAVRSGLTQLEYITRNNGQPAAHTHKHTAKQRRKWDIYTQIYSRNSSYQHGKSGTVRLAKILHFWPCFKKPNNIWKNRKYQLSKTSHNMTFTKSSNELSTIHPQLFILSYCICAGFDIFLALYVIILVYQYASIMQKDVYIFGVCDSKISTI